MDSARISFNSLLRISTIFGIVIVIYDLLMVLFKAQVLDIALVSNSVWVSLKYLVWAIGSFYVLKWMFSVNSRLSYFSYLGYMVIVGVLVSLYDVFFLGFYFRFIEPGSFSQVYSYFMEAFTMIFRDEDEQFLQLITESMLFSGYLFNIVLSYVVIFLFYSIFYTIFLKLIYKRKKG